MTSNNLLISVKLSDVCLQRKGTTLLLSHAVRTQSRSSLKRSGTREGRRRHLPWKATRRKTSPQLGVPFESSTLPQSTTSAPPFSTRATESGNPSGQSEGQRCHKRFCSWKACFEGAVPEPCEGVWKTEHPRCSCGSENDVLLSHVI